MAVKTYLADIWSATEFRSAELDGYAEDQMCADIRKGVRIMALLSLGMQVCTGVLAAMSDAGFSYLYTTVILGALSLHVMISVNYVKDINALQMLGMVLLLVTALAISFLAHQNGDLNIGMLAGVIMLFIAIPLVPWALREAVIVIGLTYGLLTASFISVPGRFDPSSLMSLQLLIAGAAVIVTVVIARNTFIRKQDIRTQFELEKAHREMQILSMKDHLTGAWNRRFLDHQFLIAAEHHLDQQKTLHVAVLDIDDFKGINDQFGHQIGDEVLIAIGKVFVDLLGTKGWLIRLGGDEFEILYCGDDLKGLIGRAIEQLHELPEIEQLTGNRKISLSAGFTSTKFDRSIDLAKLYKAADDALYAAKKARPNIAPITSQTGTWRL